MFPPNSQYDWKDIPLCFSHKDNFNYELKSLKDVEKDSQIFLFQNQVWKCWKSWGKFSLAFWRQEFNEKQLIILSKWNRKMISIHSNSMIYFRVALNSINIHFFMTFPIKCSKIFEANYFNEITHFPFFMFFDEMFLNCCGFYFLSLLSFWLKRLWGVALGWIVNKPIWIINDRWLKKIKELFQAFQKTELF